MKPFPRATLRFLGPGPPTRRPYWKPNQSKRHYKENCVLRYCKQVSSSIPTSYHICIHKLPTSIPFCFVHLGGLCIQICDYFFPYFMFYATAARKKMAAYIMKNPFVRTYTLQYGLFNHFLGVDEMMRNASCFVILFIVGNWYISWKRQASKSNSLTCIIQSPQFEHQTNILCLGMHIKCLMALEKRSNLVESVTAFNMLLHSF